VSASVASIAHGNRRRRSRAQLGYLESLRLAKSYLLCPQCFRRSFEAALEREGLDVAVTDERQPAAL
jgi:hypothetical protein